MNVTRDEEKPLHEDENKFMVAWVPAVAVGKCVICESAHEHVLSLRWYDGKKKWEYLILCPEGERVLLFKLLRGYIARKMSGIAKAGYNGPIPRWLIPGKATSEDPTALLNRLTSQKKERSL